jgi:hypothetical protein
MVLSEMIDRAFTVITALQDLFLYIILMCEYNSYLEVCYNLEVSFTAIIHTYIHTYIHTQGRERLTSSTTVLQFNRKLWQTASTTTHPEDKLHF